MWNHFKRSKRTAKPKTKVIDKCSLQIFDYRGKWLMEVRTNQATIYLRGADSVEFALDSAFEDRVKGYIDRYLQEDPPAADRFNKESGGP